MNYLKFFIYLLAMAGVTYLIRMLPLVLVKKKIENKFLLSFLYYVPYSVLAIMTIPACFYATGNFKSAVVGLAVALVLAYRERSLLTVAAGTSAAVLIAEVVMRYVL